MTKIGLELDLEIRIIMMMMIIANTCSAYYVPGFMYTVLLFLQ